MNNVLPKILLLDNFDSFTYILADYFLRLGTQCKVMRNNVPLEMLLQEDYDGIVLSPGPGRPENAGIMMTLLENVSGKIPVLGVCLGHQAIGLLLEAKLEKASKPMHGKLTVVNHTGVGIWQNIPQSIKVVRYHSLLLTGLPSCLESTAKTMEGEIMGIESRQLNLTGIQFHPEAALTEYGLPLLKNWVKTIGPRVKTI